MLHVGIIHIIEPVTINNDNDSKDDTSNDIIDDEIVGETAILKRKIIDMSMCMRTANITVIALVMMHDTKDEPALYNSNSTSFMKSLSGYIDIFFSSSSLLLTSLLSSNVDLDHSVDKSITKRNYSAVTISKQMNADRLISIFH